MAARLALLIGVVGMVGWGRAAGAGESSPYGVDVHEPKGPDLTLILDRVQEAGIGWVHVGMLWPWVESSPGMFDWSLYDAITAAAQARGVEVLATILYTPGWANTGPAQTGVLQTGVPDTAAWTDFCRRAAARYKGSIKYWGIWNEPNLSEFWQGSRHQYIDLLLKPGADAIHAGNPAAQVGGPALAHLESARWFDWLNDIISLAGNHLDFFTHHVYDTGGNSNVTSKLDDSTVFGDLPGFWSLSPPSVKEVLKHAGGWGKPFWLTETGWQSGVVGDDRQAQYYTGMLSDWFTGNSQRSWMNKIFFYEIRDGSTPTSPSWGILHPDGSPKPAYTAYKAFIAGNQPAAIDEASLVATNIPVSMEAGQTVTVQVTMKNTGNSTWTEAAGYRLGAPGDLDNFAPSRQLLAPGEAIAPGKQRTFVFSFAAPASPNTYLTHWQMLREQVAWFGDTLSQRVTVKQAPPVEARTLALLGKRFAVRVSWHDLQSNTAGFGRAVPGSDETGTFWFFDPSNIELVTKALDGRPVNNRFWFFYGALSNVEYWITVTDSVTGAVDTYYNPPGNLCGRGDTTAFSSNGKSQAVLAPSESAPPPSSGPLPEPLAAGAILADDPSSSSSSSSSGSCVADAQDLCLLGNRFQVNVQWRTPVGVSGAGTAVPASDQTGTFWFFDPSNIELVVKVLDGRTLTGKFWFFYGALSDVQYTITVTDTVTGTSKRYRNRQGNLCGVGDTSALD
ncbi:MAG TPA: NBR1-Ig-like domain-containing protein [Thermoanaerobaculia bacterium]|nr:NBR1-Ig-like domain-containing protein [Thermoanaerobaculia bacterium]